MRQAASTRRKSKRHLQFVPPPRTRQPEDLTAREQEILLLIWSGFRNKEIGHELRISVKTVEAHRANMMKKMRVSNTAHLLRTAIQGGLLKTG
jgi:DNA-binding NarL/FixJ family response regulator